MRLDTANFHDIERVARSAGRSPLRRGEYSVLAAQVANGAWVAIDGEERPVALGGLYLYPDGAAREAWIWLGPGLGSRLAALVKAVRRLLDEQSGVPVVTRVKGGNLAGQRLAWSLGFRPTKHDLEGGQVWRRAT